MPPAKKITSGFSATERVKEAQRLGAGPRIERIVRLSSSACEALDSFPMRLHW